ncbi:MAG: outer membrane lipoprotein carrier protein LolA [Phycisphaerae bacterium]
MYPLLTLLLASLTWFTSIGVLTASTTSPATAPATALPEDATARQVLEALEAAGQDLRTLQADITLTEADPAIGANPPRSGRVLLLDEAGRQQVRVILETKEVNGQPVEERIEYLVEGDRIIERNYNRKVEVTRTLGGGQGDGGQGEGGQGEGQAGRDLFRLGSGPVPLLIGQSPADVEAAFAVEKRAPTRRDPAGTVHLRLTPLPAGGFAEQFAWVDVWVTRDTGLPARVRTLDANQTTLRTTDLAGLRLNAPLPADAFAMPPVGNDWQRIME